MEYLGIAAFVVVFGAVARWFQLAWRVDLPQDPTGFRVVIGIGLLLGVASVATQSGGALAYGAMGLAAFYLYLSFTGWQRNADTRVDVGDAMPAFSAPDDTNSTFDSASLAGSRVLLKFFRGHW